MPEESMRRKCVYCKKYVNMNKDETKNFIRIYCPYCFRDDEVVIKRSGDMND